MSITSDDFKKPVMRKKLPKVRGPVEKTVQQGGRAARRMGMGAPIEMGRKMIRNPTRAMTGQAQPQMMNEVTKSKKKVQASATIQQKYRGTGKPVPGTQRTMRAVPISEAEFNKD